MPSLLSIVILSQLLTLPFCASQQLFQIRRQLVPLDHELRIQCCGSTFMADLNAFFVPALTVLFSPHR